MQLWVITRLLFLMILANGTPVVAKKILGDRFSRPLDNGARCSDGEPLFGASKTIRGILLSVLLTMVSAYFVGLGFKIGALVGSAAMAGDLFSSFLKRRLRLTASSRAIGLDQVPEFLFPLEVRSYVRHCLESFIERAEGLSAVITSQDTEVVRC